MILLYGDCTSLVGNEWYMLELRSEKTIESTMRRVGKAIPSIFRGDSIEIFIPVFQRDLDIFETKTGCYIFVRSSNFQSLLRLKTITGVVSLVTEGESNRPSKAIKVEDSYVQSIIKEADEEFRNQAIGIEVGSFVRILNGETRDFCGVVEVIGDGRAIVRITLKTKSILLETPIRNLLNLPQVPPEQRVYYFCPLVEELVEELGEEGLKLIEDDLHLDEEVTPDYSPVEAKKHSRQRTVTALVKKLVLVENIIDPMEISRHVIAALKVGEVRAPKNLFIIYCIIKDTLMLNYFKRIDPNLTNYREVIHKYGKKYRFSAQQLASIDPNLGIPIITDNEELSLGEAPRKRGRPRKIVPEPEPIPVLKSKGKKKKPQLKPV